MKKFITGLAIVAALTGVIIVKANEAKFASTASAVFYDNGGLSAVSLIPSNSATQFQIGATGQQATIKDVNGNPHPLWQEAAKSNAVYFQP